MKTIELVINCLITSPTLVVSPDAIHQFNLMKLIKGLAFVFFTFILTCISNSLLYFSSYSV